MSTHTKNAVRAVASPPRARIAVVSTPRSGNSWLRMLLSGIYACESLASHSPEEIPWEALPDDIVLQMHDHAEPALTDALDEHGFRVVVLARHPLDVLISILHYARRDSSTARWLAGEGGDETKIATSSPLDSAFLEYATGPRAQRLLSLSREWWNRPDAVKVRYEDLCADATTQVQALVASFIAARASVEDVVAAHTLSQLRRSVSSHHFWQGRPGHWRTLLPADLARTIEDAHRESFELFGYDVGADPALDPTTARRNWGRIANPPKDVAANSFAAVRETDAREIRRLRAERYAVLAALDKEHKTRLRIEATASHLRNEVDSLRTALARLRSEHDEVVRQARTSTHAAEALGDEVQWRKAREVSLQEEIDWRKGAAARLDEELEAMRSRAVAAEASAARLASSRSFRFTAPLRLIGRLAPGSDRQSLDRGERRGLA